MPYAAGTRVLLPPPLTDLSQDSFDTYLQWTQSGGDSGTLQEHIVEHFRRSVVATSPYSDANRPDETTSLARPYGGIVLRLIAIPATRTPAYQRILEEWAAYMSSLEDMHAHDQLRKDYRTREGRLYFALAELRHELESRLESEKEGKEGVQHRLDFLAPPEEEIEAPQVLDVRFDVDYSALTEQNAWAWAHAKRMISEGNKNVDGYGRGEKEVRNFKRLLKQDTLERLGGFPESTRQWPYAFGDLTYVHRVTPYAEFTASEVHPKFLKPAPEEIDKVRKNSAIGDFEKTERMRMEAWRKRLWEKELVDDEFMKDYDPQFEGERIFVNVHGVRRRLSRYIREKTHRDVNQSITLRRTKSYRPVEDEPSPEGTA